MSVNERGRMMTLEEFWESGEFIKHLEPNGPCKLCRQLEMLREKDLEQMQEKRIDLFDHLAGLYCHTYGLHRYVVEIEEKYHRTVAVYARDMARAEKIADSLCDNGVIDMEKNAYAGRSFNVIGGTHPFDSSGLEQFIDENGV